MQIKVSPLNGHIITNIIAHAGQPAGLCY